jgi:transcriptional regulator with XRE-family HTH domain
MESGSHGPVVERALLTAELRRLRQLSGKRQQDVARDCEWSVSKFTRIENGTTPVTKTDLEALLRYYGVSDPDQLAQWTTRARYARGKGWWDEFGLDDKAFEAYLGYEEGAAGIRMNQLIIPGLLQIPKYTRALMESYGNLPERVERQIRLRQERQRRVNERSPTQVYILDESALVRPTGDVMPEQLRHLVSMARKPNITIHVIPFSRGPHAGIRGPFVLLGFDVSLDSVLYLESARSGDLLIAETREQVSNSGVPTVTDPGAEVGRYEDMFTSLTEIALDPDESVKYIEKIAKDLEKIAGEP